MENPHSRVANKLVNFNQLEIHFHSPEHQYSKLKLCSYAI